MGFQLDLFPTVVSAIAGQFGIAPQVWLGIRPLRLRLISAHMHLPDAFTFDDDVVDPSLTVVASTIDYTFGHEFDGWWLCSGVESWFQGAAARNGSGRGECTSAIFTFGGGYIWRFFDDLYVDPWLGLHWVLDGQRHQVGDVTYSPFPLSINPSIKVGWFGWVR